MYCSGGLQLGLLTFARYVATFCFLKLMTGAKFSLKHHSAGARVAAGEGPSGAEEEHCPDRNNFSGGNSCVRPGKSILPSCMSCAQHKRSISRLAHAVALNANVGCCKNASSSSCLTKRSRIKMEMKAHLKRNWKRGSSCQKHQGFGDAYSPSFILAFIQVLFGD